MSIIASMTAPHCLIEHQVRPPLFPEGFAEAQNGFTEATRVRPGAGADLLAQDSRKFQALRPGTRPFKLKLASLTGTVGRRPIRWVQTSMDKLLAVIVAGLVAVMAAVTMGYIAHYDLGLSRITRFAIWLCWELS